MNSIVISTEAHRFFIGSVTEKSFKSDSIICSKDLSTHFALLWSGDDGYSIGFCECYLAEGNVLQGVSTLRQATS